MTLDQAQAILHKLYTGDENTPTSSDGEYGVRTTLLNAGLNAWENEYGMLWSELWSTLTDAATGDKTVNASDTVYAAPTNFKFLGGYVETYTDTDQRTKWQVLKPEKAAVLGGDAIQVTGLAAGHVWVTGNPSTGYSINFSSQPTSGNTINYPYYTVVTELSTGSDILPLPDPYFAVYFALSKLHEHDGEGDRATFAMSQAESKLENMKLLNAMAPAFQLNSIDNSTILRTNTGFGL